MSWGFNHDVVPIREALQDAHQKGVLILASASNSGANDPITFPANLPFVVCIGAADGLGNKSDFTSYKFGEEKYIALGVAVSGAKARFYEDKKLLEERRSGTSTATPIAAGIAALLIGYVRQSSYHIGDIELGNQNIRKLFLAMSAETVGSPNRFLAPWSLFEDQVPIETIQRIVEGPLGRYVTLSNLHFRAREDMEAWARSWKVFQ